MKTIGPALSTETDQVADAVRRVFELCDQTPSIAVILGSGLGAAGQAALDAGGRWIDFADIPGMPQPAVVGHAGRLIVGTGALAGVVLLQGRVHWYEGHSVAAITFATRLLAQLGVRTLIVSNAAGGINSKFRPGDLMLIDGHFTTLPVQRPFSGSRERAIGQPDCLRSLPPGKLWSKQLRQQAAAVSTTLNVHQGSYAMMSGPNYETPAEVRMLQKLGMAAVGMSTIPEALAAAALGIRVLGISCITNVASGLSDQPLDHAEVGATAASIEAAFTAWLFDLLKRLNHGSCD